MKIQVINCSGEGLWYYNKIGEKFEVVREYSFAYQVRDNKQLGCVIDKYVYKSDCIDVDILKKNGLKIIKISE